MENGQGFDLDRFFSALDSERRAREKNWKEVSDATGVSQSTLSRLKGGTRPDIDSFAKLCSWASIDANEFLGEQTNKLSAQSSIGALLRADPSLDRNSASAIEAVLSAAYQALKLEDDG